MGAAVGVGRRVVEERFLGEAPVARRRPASKWLGLEGGDPGGFARGDVLARKVAAVGCGRDGVHAERLLGQDGGGRKLTQVAAQVSDLLFDDELVLGIYGHLRVVADAHLGVGGHGAAVWVGERHLGSRRCAPYER